MITIGGTNITKAYLGSTELKNIAIGDKLLLSSGPQVPVPIEYLESTGTQYIDTGYCPNAQTVVNFRCSTTMNNKRVCGVRDSNAKNNFECIAYGGSLGFIFRVQTSSNITFPAQSDTIYDIMMSLTTITVNDTTKTSTRSSLSESFPLVLFAGYLADQSTKVSNFSNTKMYSFSISENNVLKKDFIPVRVGRTGYLYDRVSDQLYGNSGTGNFVLGNDIT